MGIQIFEQPDGQYAVYSSTVEDFLLEDASEEEVREWYIEREKKRAEEEINERLSEAGDPPKIKGPGPDNYEEAVEIRDRN